RHTRSKRDWSSDVCSSDLANFVEVSSVLSVIDSAPGVRTYYEIEFTGFHYLPNQVKPMGGYGTIVHRGAIALPGRRIKNGSKLWVQFYRCFVFNVDLRTTDAIDPRANNIVDKVTIETFACG